MKIEKEKAEQLVERLKEKGAKEEKPPKYASYRLKLGKGELIIYESGSVVYSGKEREELKEKVAEELLKLEENLPRIGCDEAGKGEFFGPLVVACVCGDRECLRELFNLEVKDSKKLSSEKIIDTAERIKEKCRGVVRVINPENYNRMYWKYGNQNRLLEAVYSEVLSKLINRCKAKEIVVDKFSRKVEEILKKKIKGVKVSARIGGEADSVVAAASIVAKAERLRELKKLSERLGFEVNEGNRKNRELLERIPEGELPRYVKLHFNVKE